MLGLSLALLISFLYLWFLSEEFEFAVYTILHVVVCAVIVGLIIWGGMSIL